jgi:phage tail sheath protein FI
MPSALSYPGVYVEEISSGVRTIIGVPTSITAFVGRLPRGPATGPGFPVSGFDDFTRTFGGLDLDYPMTFAVYDYFQNGGAQAVIVRLLATPQQGDTTPVAAAAKTTALPGVTASSPGAWGGVDKDHPGGLWIEKLESVDLTTPQGKQLKKQFNIADGTGLFNLTVVERVKLYDLTTGTGNNATTTPIFQVVNSETINNIVFRKDSASTRRADRVFPAESQLLTADNSNLPPKTDPTPLGEADPTGRPPSAAKAAAAKAAAAAPPPRTPAGPGSGPAPGSATTAATTPPRSFSGGADGPDSLQPGDYDFPGRLDRVDIFNLLCLPPDSLDSTATNGQIDPTILTDALTYCVQRRAMLIVDPPTSWVQASDVNPKTLADAGGADGLGKLGLNGPDARNAAVYFPRVKQSNSLRDNAVETFVPCGIVAGVMAATDVARGVWKAPAGIDAAVGGTVGLEVELTDAQNGLLNPFGINCLRTFPVYGRVVWGARTLRGADALADDYKYVPVRRLALYIEESLYRGTKWVVFEPNGETLWAQIRSSVGSFMQGLFRQGAFAGGTPAQAYFVNCDATTNPDILVNQGVVTVKVGFAPLFPAEFVVIQLTQIVGTTG